MFIMSLRAGSPTHNDNNNRYLTADSPYSSATHLSKPIKNFLCAAALLLASLPATQAAAHAIPISCADNLPIPESTAKETGRNNSLLTDDGQSIPFYMVKFNKQGQFASEEDRLVSQQLIKQSSGYSDVFFFSHGWNNDWTTASGRYLNFFKQYHCLCQTKGLDLPADYKPMVVGVYWPATSFTFGAAENGPEGNDDNKYYWFDSDYSEAEFHQHIQLLQDEIEDKFQREKLAQLLQENDVLSESQVLELAKLLMPIFTKDNDNNDDEVNLEDKTISLQNLLDDWKDTLSNDNKKNLKPLLYSPRDIVRIMTFSIMRKRAGIIGRQGASAVVQDMLSKSQARIHLIGHSYGAKVVLSALNATDASGQKAHSLLLLQPAISYLAFESKIKFKTCNPLTSCGNIYKSGAYYSLLDKVQAPILSTFSKQDFPLRHIFHRIMNRTVHIGEDDGDAHTQQKPISPLPLRISKYAALGGFGPKSSPLSRRISIKAVGDYYPLHGKIRIYGLNGSTGEIPGKRRLTPIDSHGSIINDYTAWALYNLVRYTATP